MRKIITILAITMLTILNTGCTTQEEVTEITDEVVTENDGYSERTTSEFTNEVPE